MQNAYQSTVHQSSKLYRKARQGVSKATEAVRHRGRRKQNPLELAASQASINSRKQLESAAVRPACPCRLA